MSSKCTTTYCTRVARSLRFLYFILVDTLNRVNNNSCIKKKKKNPIQIYNKIVNDEIL